MGPPLPATLGAQQGSPLPEDLRSPEQALRPEHGPLRELSAAMGYIQPAGGILDAFQEGTWQDSRMNRPVWMCCGGRSRCAPSGLGRGVWATTPLPRRGYSGPRSQAPGTQSDSPSREPLQLPRPISRGWTRDAYGLSKASPALRASHPLPGTPPRRLRCQAGGCPADLHRDLWRAEAPLRPGLTCGRSPAPPRV